MSIQRSILVASLVAGLVLLTGTAAALAADPPGRVGRLSLVEGTVSMRTATQDNQNTDASAGTAANDWTPATLNYPMTSGNSLWTEAGARAEVQIGAAQVRLSEQTELEVARLDDQSVNLALHQGVVNLHLDSPLPGGLQIDTPRGPVTFTQPGTFRIAVDTNSEKAADAVEVAAFTGEARLGIDDGTKTDIHTVKGGERLKLAGDPADIVIGQARTTSFDEWARARDPRSTPPQMTGQAASPSVGPAVGQTVNPVSPQVTGYQDLGAYGTWEPSSAYGSVWYPRVVVDDWAPYRYGHWAFIPPWGWTWIDDAPWGFAPFHYGRWVHIGHRWAWWPGARAVRPVYAPALVAFVGGDGWSVSITSGRPVGWLPLAPYEIYRPHYRTSATYIRNVNITTVNKTVINNITVNRMTEVNRFANRSAATVVSSDAFAHGRRVNEAKIDVPRKQLDRARVNSGEIRAIAPANDDRHADQPRPPQTARKFDERSAPERTDGPAPQFPMSRGSSPRDQIQKQDVQRNQVQEQQRREQVQKEQRQRDQVHDQQRREQVQQQQRQRDQAQEQQRREQTQQQQRQRDQAQEQQRRERSQQEQRQRDQIRQQQQQRRNDDAREQQRRQNQMQDQQVQDQRRQVQEQQRRQAEQQRQSEAQDQQRRAQANQLRRQQAEQQRQQQEQAREEQRRRRPPADPAG